MQKEARLINARSFLHDVCDVHSCLACVGLRWLAKAWRTVMFPNGAQPVGFQTRERCSHTVDANRFLRQCRVCHAGSFRTGMALFGVVGQLCQSVLDLISISGVFDQSFEHPGFGFWVLGQKWVIRYVGLKISLSLSK